MVPPIVCRNSPITSFGVFTTREDIVCPRTYFVRPGLSNSTSGNSGIEKYLQSERRSNAMVKTNPSDVRDGEKRRVFRHTFSSANPSFFVEPEVFGNSEAFRSKLGAMKRNCPPIANYDMIR